MNINMNRAKEGRELLRTVKNILEEEFSLNLGLNLSLASKLSRDPKITGYRIISYVRKLPEGVDIRVSRFAPAEEEDIWRDKDYLRNPLSRRELAQALKKVLGWN